jgi:sarcosine/dimethylglycine N-methyltransferase
VIAAADGGEVYFPVPWAEGQATSFLITAENLREVLKNQGFEIVIWSDHTNATIEWFTELSKLQSAGAAQSTPPVALNIVIGSDFAVKTKNLKRNLQEGRLGILEAVARKPL